MGESPPIIMIRYSDVAKDIGLLPEFISWFESELDNAKKECSIYGNLEKRISELPGITEHRFNQLQEIEALLRYLEIQLRKIRRDHFQKYLEKYNKTLTSRDAEKYVDGEEEVITYELFINDVSLIRNKWMGVIKGIEQKSYMLGHIARLKCAGMEDASI